MTDQDDNLNQNEEEMDEELINQEDGEAQDVYAIEVEINQEMHIIIIGKSDENKIFWRIMDKEDQSKFYQNEFSLEDLRSLNPIFNGIDSIDLAFQYFFSNLNDAEKDLKIIDDDKINFIITIADEDEKLTFEFPLYKTIDEGNGDNEVEENLENMENEMEEEMINEVNESNELHEVNEVNEANGEVESAQKEKNLEFKNEEKNKEEIDKKNNLNIPEVIETKKENKDFDKQENNLSFDENNKNLLLMKKQILGVVSKMNDNFKDELIQQEINFTKMKDDIIKQNDIKINKINEELNKKNEEINELKNNINNLQQKINDINTNNENNNTNKSLRNSKAENINNKTVNELKENINEIKTLYEKDKKDKENIIKILSEKINNLENKSSLNKNKENDAIKIKAIEKDLKALENRINNYEFDQLVENMAILLEKQDDTKIYEVINNLGNQINEMNQKLNKKELTDSKRGNVYDKELINRIDNDENIILKLQTKVNKIQEEREKEKLNESNNKYKLPDIIKITSDLKSLTSKFDSLNTQIKKLENENKELKNSISKMVPNVQSPYIQTKKISAPKKNYYQTSENNNYPQENRIPSYSRTNPNLSNHNFSDGLIDSKIVNFDDIIFIQNRIKKIHPKIKDVYFNLCYRATEDGDKAADFHKKCDTIGPNVVIIKTRKGNIFGGFTFKNWEHLPRDIDIKRPNLGSASRDSNAFGFSVNNQKIYNNEKPNEFAIWCNKNFGPTFKNNLFQIFDSCMKKGGYCSIRNNSHFGGQMTDYEISGGESKFKVDELEVFEVKLI